MNKKYIVRLSKKEREELLEVVKKLKGSSQKVKRAQILLKADVRGPKWTDHRIAEAFGRFIVHSVPFVSRLRVVVRCFLRISRNRECLAATSCCCHGEYANGSLSGQRMTIGDDRRSTAGTCSDMSAAMIGRCSA